MRRKEMSNWSSRVYFLVDFLLVINICGCSVTPTHTDEEKTVYSTPNKPWGYGDKEGKGGADLWASHDKTCGGKFQSPIAFWQEDVVVDNRLPPFEFLNYDIDLRNLKMDNNGHTIKIELPEKPSLKIKGGGLPGDTYYRLAQFHFHWGASDETGSEHKLGSSYYPFEMHLVHIKEPLGIAEALKDPQGLAVLGVFFEHSDVDNNTALQPLIDVMDHVQNKGGHMILRKPIKARDLLPVDVSNFYRYQGSLTTPPCSEVVTWTVFVDVHPITTKQLDNFRSVRKQDTFLARPVDSDDYDLADKLLFNHRPVQELYDRRVAIRKALKCAIPSKKTSDGNPGGHGTRGNSAVGINGFQYSFKITLLGVITILILSF